MRSTASEKTKVRYCPSPSELWNEIKIPNKDSCSRVKPYDNFHLPPWKSCNQSCFHSWPLWSSKVWYCWVLNCYKGFIFGTLVCHAFYHGFLSRRGGLLYVSHLLISLSKPFALSSPSSSPYLSKLCCTVCLDPNVVLLCVVSFFPISGAYTVVFGMTCWVLVKKQARGQSTNRTMLGISITMFVLATMVSLALTITKTFVLITSGAAHSG